MKKFRWEIMLGSSLVLLSAVLYFVHYLIFRDPHHIFIYLVGDIAFVPVEVLLVTMIIHKLLEEREKRAKMEKLNMVIEVFFSEIGTRLLAVFSDADPRLDMIRKELAVTNNWTDKEFQGVRSRLHHDCDIDIRKIDINSLRADLIGKRDFFVRLLENPVLLEHEHFTEILRSVFHLTEELANRADTGQLPDTDLTHLSGDIKRAYRLLIDQWLNYMIYLRSNYPYLFSLAVRLNPFDQTATAVVR